MDTQYMSDENEGRKSTDLHCPLCQAAEGKPFYQDSREYFRCPVCTLVFVLPCQFLSAKEEKSVYDLHENSADDPGYRHFLARVAAIGPQQLRS
jgi:hypothetical protein